MSKKKPDLVVWDENRGYYAKELTYGSNQGAPVINIEDVKGWRAKEVINVNHQFEAEYNKLKEEFEQLINEYHLNSFIYSKVEYSFLPIVGETYYLYQRQNGVYFLSIITPGQWNQKFIFAVTLDAKGKWNKVISTD